ncbi:hypothetical protein GCM10023156_49910 [Novipirellula rosea]|uniref:CHAT domain protein n=1 Tax=Novipirellula rosea TaxID=1031540 RepID=A0ABP8NDH7_9BACT
MLYLCDDYTQTEDNVENIAELTSLFPSLWQTIKNIEQTQRLKAPIDVVYQFDAYHALDLSELSGTQKDWDQHCIRRYLSCENFSDQRSSFVVKRSSEYKTINTGRTQTLKDFFEWAKSPIERAQNVIFVLAGLGVGDKRSVVGNINRDRDFGRIFSICDDNSAKDALNPIELQNAIETLVNDYRDGEPIDLLGFDMASMQFIEVAYQFAGLARTMVASQNNGFEPCWPYEQLIQETGKLVRKTRQDRGFVGPKELGPLFVKTIGSSTASYLQAQHETSGRLPDFHPIVSAIDLGQLDVVARSLDTFFLNLLQTLGDEAIWTMRESVFLRLKKSHQQNTDSSSRHKPRTMISHDLLHLLQVVCEEAEKLQNAEGAFDAWYAKQLRELSESRDSTHLFDRKPSTSQDKRQEAGELSACRVQETMSEVVDNVKRIIHDRLSNKTTDEGEQQRGGLGRTWRVLQLIGFDNELKVFCPVLDKYEKAGNTAADREDYGNLSSDEIKGYDLATMASLRQLCERFDRLSVEQLKRSAAKARHIFSIAHAVMTLVTPPPLEQDSELAGFRCERKDLRDRSARCILAQHAFMQAINSSLGSSNEELNLPLHCGISIYRPEHLDRLAQSQYLDFSFHRNVHWVSLLAAINLIRKHPGQLWDIVSSLLSTCTGSGRDELLQRLAGPHSVLNRFGNQFRAMQNPLTLTLSVSENREDQVSKEPIHDAAGHRDDGRYKGSSPSSSDVVFSDKAVQEKLGEGITYKLTLETNRQDAFVDSGVSTLNRRRVNRALQRLEEIITPTPYGEQNNLHAMESFARDLGEDIFCGIDLSVSADECSMIPHLQLQLPIELMGLPWEVMNEGRLSRHGHHSRMLCERFAISRQTLVDSGVARPPLSRTSGKIRPLIIGDPLLQPDVVRRYGASQLQGALDEAREVEQLFRRLAIDLRGTIEFSDDDVHIGTTITGHDVRRLLRSGLYDIVHFAGHAMHDDHTATRSCWLLSDGGLWAQEIANTLSNCQSPPWLVYANACQAGMNTSSQSRFRTNVYGLGTAFTNNGTTAYLGPLWPIGDFVAGQMATDFYKGLLLERSTVGESLFTAKRNAKQRIEGALAGDLSWASMVAYGDSRMKLLDSIGVDESDAGKLSGAANGRQEAPKEDQGENTQRLKRLRRYSSSGQPIQPMQASVRSTRDAISDHAFCRASHSRDQRLKQVTENQVALELRQINGVRFWQVTRHNDVEFTGLPGSPLRQELDQNERLRHQLGIRSGRWVGDDSQLVGHWRIPLSANQNFGRALTELDSQCVDTEGLVTVDRDNRVSSLPSTAKQRLARQFQRRVGGRILLLMHESFGNTRSVVESLGNSFIRRAHREYVAVLGFDHWSLQRGVIECAGQFCHEFSDFVDRQANGKGADGTWADTCIDIIGLGRGGLVARAIAETAAEAKNGASQRPSVRNVVMVATPTSSCRLLNWANWAPTADILANSVHLDATGMYAKLSCALAQLSVLASPEAADDLIRRARGVLIGSNELDDSFAPLEGVQYSSIATAYAPGAAVSVARTLQECCEDNPFFQRLHDLIVGIDDTPVHDHRVESLLIHPTNTRFCASAVASPEQPRSTSSTQVIACDSIHHTNLLSHPDCRRFIAQRLFDNDAP